MQQVNCPRCSRQTLAGQSNGGRALATDIRLDPSPLDPAGELLALVTGRRTWTVRHGMHGMDAWSRDAATITRWPAGSRPRHGVHADHACGEGKP